jgi:IPT/TIG domain
MRVHSERMKRYLLLALWTAGVSLGTPAMALPVIDLITPSVGPSSGGTEVTIKGDGLLMQAACLLPCPTTVTFGDITVTVDSDSEHELRVTTPAHAPGPVDVIVHVTGEQPVTKANGFTFAASPEPSYEQILLPIHLDGVVPGAFGAQWKTDLWLRNNSLDAVTLVPWPCGLGDPCPGPDRLTFTLSARHSLHNLPPLDAAPDGNPSRLLYVARPGATSLSLGLRFADVSRSTLDGGADLPVIRESELLTTTAQLFDVPLGSTFRVLLRVYDAEFSSSQFQVTLYPQAETVEAPVYSTVVTATSVYTGDFRPKAAYAPLDITGFLQLPLPWPQNVRIEITPLTPGSRYWAFASVTNNTTQAVTLVTPQ